MEEYIVGLLKGVYVVTDIRKIGVYKGSGPFLPGVYFEGASDEKLDGEWTGEVYPLGISEGT